MHESTERERRRGYTRYYFFITAVQQDLHNALESVYHTVADEKGWIDHVNGVQETGIPSAEFFAVKLLAPCRSPTTDRP